jgi:hypothetical protein
LAFGKSFSLNLPIGFYLCFKCTIMKMEFKKIMLLLLKSK